MKSLTFKCKIKDKQRLDMSWLSRIDTTNLSDIKKLAVSYGSKIYKISKLFDVSGSNYKNIIIKKVVGVNENKTSLIKKSNLEIKNLFSKVGIFLIS